MVITKIIIIKFVRHVIKNVLHAKDPQIKSQIKIVKNAKTSVMVLNVFKVVQLELIKVNIKKCVKIASNFVRNVKIKINIVAYNAKQMEFL